MAIRPMLNSIYIASLFLISLTACAQPSLIPPGPIPELVAHPSVKELKSLKERLQVLTEDLNDTKERHRTLETATAALRGELARCRKRLDDLVKQLAEARTKILKLLDQVEGLHEPPKP